MIENEQKIEKRNQKENSSNSYEQVIKELTFLFKNINTNFNLNNFEEEKEKILVKVINNYII